MNKKKQVLTRPVFFSLTKFFIDICQKVSVNYNHLLIILDVRQNKEEIIPDTLENIFLKFKTYIDSDKSILEQVSYISKIKDINEILIYLIDIFISAYKEIEKAKIYHSYSNSIEKKYKFIEYYRNKKKEPIDEIEEECINTDFDIYDLSEFESIYTTLRKDKFSIEYLDKLSLLDVFLLYYQLIDRNIIESARYWFREKLREIDQKVNEKVPLEHSDKGETRDRTDDEKQALNDELEKQYFISDEDKQNEQINSIS